MKAYISPLILSAHEAVPVENLDQQPIYACPRCRTAFLTVDLYQADLIRSKEVHSPNNALHVSFRFWRCLSCKVSLHAAKVGTTERENAALKARIETAMDSLFGKLRAELPPERVNAAFMRETEALLASIENSM